MVRKVLVVNDFEDSDEEWAINPEGSYDIPRSTPTGKAVLREVAQGHVVAVNFDDGGHEKTKLYLKAMCAEYSLPLSTEDRYVWVISPEPQVEVDSIPDDPE